MGDRCVRDLDVRGMIVKLLHNMGGYLLTHTQRCQTHNTDQKIHILVNYSKNLFLLLEGGYLLLKKGKYKIYSCCYSNFI